MAKAKFRITEARDDGIEFHHTTLWEGEADTIQLRDYDHRIKTPTLINVRGDGTICITYTGTSNVRIDLEEENGYTTAWCRPAVKEGDIEEIIKENKDRK